MQAGVVDVVRVSLYNFNILFKRPVNYWRAFLLPHPSPLQKEREDDQG